MALIQVHNPEKPAKPARGIALAAFFLLCAVVVAIALVHRGNQPVSPPGWAISFPVPEHFLVREVDGWDRRLLHVPMGQFYLQGPTADGSTLQIHVCRDENIRDVRSLAHDLSIWKDLPPWRDDDQAALPTIRKLDMKGHAAFEEYLDGSPIVIRVVRVGKDAYLFWAVSAELRPLREDSLAMFKKFCAEIQFHASPK